MSDIQMAGPWVTEVEEKYVLDALRDGWYGANAYRYVETFERDFAAYHDRRHALMTPNCTSAIHLILKALDIGPGDEVIAPECTWVGSIAGITYQGAETVFADIDPIHWCLTPETVERAMTERTKAVIVVDLYGNMPDLEAIQALCDARGVTMIEDAAESLGSLRDGVRAGKFGAGSVFSFHRTKTLTTGEGGVLLLDDEALFERCKFLRDHGRQPGSYFNTEITPKYMPFNLQAALAYGQLQRLDELVDKKRWIWRGYQDRLADIDDLHFNPEPANVKNGVWATALVFGESLGCGRDDAIEAFPKMDLPIRPFFYPLSFLPAFDREAQGRRDNPISYDVSERGVVLPSALNMTEAQLDRMADGIRRFVGRGGRG